MNFFSGIINGINDVANKVFEAVLLLLPTSPFVNIKSYIDPLFFDIMGYVNYYLPLGTIVTIISAWLGAIAVYYMYQLVLRTVKAVE